MENNRITEIELEIEKLFELIRKKGSSWDYQNHTFDEYEKHLEPESNQIDVLSRERRLLMVPDELSDLPEYGHIMPLKEFIENVEDGGFIDYDGYGLYVKDGKQTEIVIYPSDVHHNAVRKDMDTIIWFNR